MAKTAVGLFETSALVDEVVHDLKAVGIEPNEVRVSRIASGDAGYRSLEYSAHRFRRRLVSRAQGGRSE
jgi:hypothetical protein